MKNELEIHKGFLLKESNSQTPEVLVQSVIDAVSLISISSNRDKSRKEYSLSQLRKLKFEIKKLQNKIEENYES